jgi:VWFA-related protein
MEAMSRLRIPGFSESNMFDALADTADRMSKIEGRKAILLIASGIDTFSKLTYDKARKALQEYGVPVYSIEMLQIERIMAEGRMGASQELDFLQGDNELKTFAKETGGQAFFPRFTGELPNVFHAISQSLRSQYSLSYSPNNQAKDGKFRKITVQLVDPATNEPVRMLNDKNKPMKYTILAKAGYKAPRAVE